MWQTSNVNKRSNIFLLPLFWPSEQITNIHALRTWNSVYKHNFGLTSLENSSSLVVLYFCHYFINNDKIFIIIFSCGSLISDIWWPSYYCTLRCKTFALSIYCQIHILFTWMWKIITPEFQRECFLYCEKFLV